MWVLLWKVCNAELVKESAFWNHRGNQVSEYESRNVQTALGGSALETA